MAKPGQYSFRRILLSRLLLLSVPVLLLGVYVTYRKARSTLLGTARQNLLESAQRKGQDIQKSVAALKGNLEIASDNVELQSQSPKAYQQFIDKLAQQLPIPSQCVQLEDIQTRQIVASTCGNRAIAREQATIWPWQRTLLPKNRSPVYVSALSAQQSSTAASANAKRTDPNDQLPLVFSAPVYNAAGQLRYSLIVQSSLLHPQKAKPRSLSGYAVVINQQGTILAHVDPHRVGRKLNQEKDGGALRGVVEQASAGDEGSLHLFSFEKQGVELVAGYTAIDSPLTAEPNQKWTILSITSLEIALYGLKDIQQVLFVLTCGLIAACLLATLYVARDLARPLEKLRDYALHESDLHSTDRIPRNFNIREFNQLSEAFEGMISRMRAWAEELEAAWKEAQTANQLKNEFLANTSHELRTPLNGIIGCLRLVRDGFCDDREEELDFLQRADDAAIHLLGIINDVLDIAKIEAGKLSVEVEPVDLRKILNEVINLQAVPIQQKGLEFDTTDLHDVIPVRADPAKLKQVLLNVVGNAVKFTEAGSITINTRIEPFVETPSSAISGEKIGETLVRGQGKDERFTSALTSEGSASSAPVFPSSQVVVTVQDTGIGIDPDQQHKLFRPFVMVDGSTTRKCGGTGLGLAISRNLMVLMGGNITLSSDGNDRGTTVEISLPMIEPALLLSGESQKSSDIDPMSASTDTSAEDSNGAAPSRKPQLKNCDN
jgi:two-component system, NarL family, sensor histidine kinase BarA